MLISGFVIRLFSCSLVAFGNRPIIPARLPWRCKQVENVNPPPQNFLFLAAYRVICIRPKVRLLLLFFNDVMSWKLEPSLLCFSLLHSSYIVQQQIYKKKSTFLSVRTSKSRYILCITLFEIFIFCPKIQLWFPEKIVDFFGGEKLVKMLWFWTF